MKNFSQLNFKLVLLLLICFAKDLKAFQAYNKGKVDKTESTNTKDKEPKPGFFSRSCLGLQTASLQVVYKSTNPELKVAEEAKAAAEKEKPLLIQDCDPDFWARKTREAILTKEYLRELKKEKARKKAEKEQEAEHKKKLSASNTPEKPNTSPANK